MEEKRTVSVYVDGFALYLGALKGRFAEYKWLDLWKLAENLYPNRTVVAVKYFTAPLLPIRSDPQVMIRQASYWRALETTPVEIIRGNFKAQRQWLPTHPEVIGEDGEVELVRVKRHEEKGTDVALATHLIFDAFQGVADSYAVMTNDSDLLMPMKMLVDKGHKLSLVSVADERYNGAFNKIGLGDPRQLRPQVLRASQFPQSVPTASGQNVRKPQSWP